MKRAPQSSQRDPSGREPKPNLDNVPTSRTWLTFLAILALNYLLMRWLLPAADEAITIPYTAFKEQVAAGNVESIYSKGASIEGRFEKSLLRRHRKQLDALVQALLARETLDEQQILEVTGLTRAPELETSRVAAADSR
jgi:hypothetical protein